MRDWLNKVWQKLAPGRAAPGAGATGARGEKAAAEVLAHRHQFRILTRNWRDPRDRRDEIDLVARDGEVLVFVEVKTRTEHALVPGYHAIDERKQRALRRAVHAYLTALPEPPLTFRFDVVEVQLGECLPPQCLHFENIPLFPNGYHLARQTGALAQVSRGSGGSGGR